MNKKHRDLTLSATAFSLLDSNYYDKWEDYEMLYKSEHDKAFIDLAKKYERSHIFIPTAKSILDILEAIFSAAFFSAGNPIEIIRNEVKESKLTNVLNVLVEDYYKKSKPYIALNMAFSSAARFGVGAVLPYWDKDKKLPITRYIPPTQIAFDAEAMTRDEIQHVSYKFKQTHQDIEAKVKSKFYDKIKKKDLGKMLGYNYDDDTQRYKRVQVTEVYSVKVNGKYNCRTFIKKKLVREKVFKTNPIKHGYLAPVLPSVDETIQEDQCAGVGESVLETVKHLVKELNVKRNQIIDINESIIDPYTMVGDNARIDPEDAGRIKGVVNVGQAKDVQRFPPSSAFAIEKDVALTQRDLDDVTAINGMQKGQTSTSDRRPAAAMAMINANSSSRLTKMATTINDTLFNPWAEAFVRDIYINAPDKLVLELCGEDGLIALGRQGARQELDYVVNINFGKTINREAKISELTMLLQMLNGREDADIMPILVEVLKLILGDSYDEKAIFSRVLGVGGQGTALGGDGGEEGGTVGVGTNEITDQTQGGAGPDGAGTGNSNNEEYAAQAAATNRI